MLIDRINQKFLFSFYVLIVITISILPTSIIKVNSIWQYDKYIHFIEYLLFGFLLINCLNPLKYTKRLFFIIFLFVIFFSGIDEFIIQKYFGKGRISDINDWFMDSLGAFVGILIRYLVKDRIK